MTQSITSISVEVLKVHPRNTEFFDDISGEEYDRFKKSIQDDGLLSPLIVAPDMTVISGHQRLKACKELGFKSVPVIIKDDLEDEDEKLKKLIAANFGRLKNDPIKQKNLVLEYERLCGVSHGGNRKSKPNNSALNQSEVAKMFGVSVDTIQNIKSLDKLLPDLQDAISQGNITPTTGYKIIAKLSEEEQITLLSKLPAAQKFTQAQVQQYIDQIKGLTETNATLAQEAVEATRAVKASTDSEEYVRMKKAKEDALQEARDNYEKWQAEKKRNDGKPPKKNEIKEAADKAREETKQQYRKMIERLEKEVEELKQQEAPEPETIEIIPDDYEEIKAELARLKASQPHKNIRSVKIDETEEQRAIEYYNFLNTSAGTFLSDMEGFAIQKEFCIPIAPEKKAFLAENLRTIMNRCAEIIDFIKECNSKEAA